MEFLYLCIMHLNYFAFYCYIIDVYIDKYDFLAFRGCLSPKIHIMYKYL